LAAWRIDYNALKLTIVGLLNRSTHMFQARTHLVSLLSILTTVYACAEVNATESTQPVDFNRDLRPILSNNCFQCHGPDEAERQADLAEVAMLMEAQDKSDISLTEEQADEVRRRLAEPSPKATIFAEFSERLRRRYGV
jgi:hypothetical protein